jgi:hypothetical protein
MGYDYWLWQQGFDTLEDIFRFVASSKYFDPDIYLLHNRNAVSRIRDAKRKTYTAFLTWCEEQKPTAAAKLFTADQKEERHAHFLWDAKMRWPSFSYHYDIQLEALAIRRDLKTRWNGNHVHAWTGLAGKELGAFMALVQADPGFAVATQNVSTLEVFVRKLHEANSK